MFKGFVVVFFFLPCEQLCYFECLVNHLYLPILSFSVGGTPEASGDDDDDDEGGGCLVTKSNTTTGYTYRFFNNNNNLSTRIIAVSHEARTLV